MGGMEDRQARSVREDDGGMVRNSTPSIPSLPASCLPRPAGNGGQSTASRAYTRYRSVLLITISRRCQVIISSTIDERRMARGTCN